MRPAAIVLVAAALAGSACARLPGTYVVLLPEADGSLGAVEMRGEEGVRGVAEPNRATGFAPDRDPVPLSREEIRETFGKALDAQPPAPIEFALYFRSETTRLTDASRKELPKILDMVKKRPAPEIAVEGYTDRAGSETYNRKLGLRRARAIRDEIVKLGIDPKTIDVVSHGETKPSVRTGDGRHEPRNRRAVVRIR